jgi:oxygen-independent coproporphyrinogen-3 oxidase
VAAPRSLYLHIPYCAAKCPYCDFNSIAGRHDEHAAYVEALLTEVRRLPPGPYNTLFIGGGTPTSLAPALLERLLSGLRQHLLLAEGYEWTCEGNPGSADATVFRILAQHGVNRLSLGVQSTHDHHLRTLGRVHDAAQAERALAAAVAAVPRVSADLIFGLPDQTMAELDADLQLYQRHGLRHASVYHLAYEPGTEFTARLKRGELHEIDPETSRAQFERVAAGLAALGLTAYETSNFAAPGQECRHNLAYWHLDDYHAAGAGAVSTVAGVRSTRHKHPAQYIAAIATGPAVAQCETIAPRDRLREAWMLGLRLAAGVDGDLLRRLGDDEARWRPIAQPLVDLGILRPTSTGVAITAAMRHLQDEITVRLMP